MSLRLFAVWFALAACAAPATAFEALRLSSQVDLDGSLTEAFWQTAPVHDQFFEAQPADRIPAKVRTEVRVAYDAKSIYIGLRAWDTGIGQLRAPFARRDKVSTDQDYIGLFIDTSGSGKAAQMIYLNPRGALTDGSFSDSAGEDMAPDFDVQVATARFDGGWSAEVRIPFSSMAYVAGQADRWRLLVMRNMTRDQRYRMYSGPVARSSNCNLCYSEPVTGLRDLPSGVHWTATPQLVARKLREREGQGKRRSDGKAELSLDVKIRPDSASVIDLTVNPDFSQVELDAPQLSGNTRFGLFVQEKRPFFLEGSDLLQSPLRAINTRAITSPAWGARYTRRGAAFDAAFLSAHDDGGGLVQLPTAYYTGYAAQSGGSQASLARAMFKFSGVSVGVVGTDRSLDDGRGYNRVAGVDFNWQRTSDDRLRGQLLYSASTAQPDARGQLALGARTSGHAGMLEWSHGAETWSINLTALDVSAGFRADNGFFSQAGYREVNTLLIRKQGKTGPLRELNLYVFGERKVDSRGDLISANSSIGAWMGGPLDSELDVHVRPGTRTRVREGGAVYQTVRVGGRIGATPGRTLAHISVEGEVGDQIDVEGERVGKGGVLSAYARVRLSDRIELEPSYSAGWTDNDNGQRLYSEQAAQVNGIVHFSSRDTLRVIAQKTRTRRTAALYIKPVAARSDGSTVSLVIGHTPSLGTAAYAGLTLSRGETPGYAPLRRANEVFVKLSWQI